jgi:general secretion pathway protein D
MTPNLALLSRLSRLPRPSAAAFGRPLLLGAVCLLAGCAASRIHDEGLSLLREGKPELAIERLQTAVKLEPSNARFEVDLLKEKAAYSRELARRGNAAREDKRFDEAAEYYQRALQFNADNGSAAQALNGLRVRSRVERATAEAEGLLQDGQFDAAAAQVRKARDLAPASADLISLQQKIDEARDQAIQAKATQAASQSVLKKSVSLQFRDAGIKMVFEALAKTTGLNVIFDRDVKADLKTTIFVHNASVEDTVDLILMQNQLEKRVLNPTSLFIYPATASKQKEYQDLVMKTFLVTNADLKYLQTLLKSVLKLKDVSIDERTGMMVVRDTADGVALATKLVAAHDVPDAEVMLEVEVLEVSADRIQNLGLQLPDTVTFSAGSTTGTTGSQTVNSLRALNRSSVLVSPLSATLNLKLQDTDSNLLASPRIRARNKEKARIVIGDRVPTITNTVTPVQTGTPVITGTVTYQEVGLKLEFEPTVYADNDVGIKISLEVSNIVQQFTDAQGGRSYQIGTRNAQTSLRLHDGDTQILGGLISDQDRSTSSKVPGLGQLPIAGRLFSNNNGDHVKSEIILSITPRIVRGLTRSDPANREVFTGTDSGLRERPMRLETTGEIRLPATLPAANPAGAAGRAAAPGSVTAPSGSPAVPPAAPAPQGAVVPSPRPAAASSSSDAAAAAGDTGQPLSAAQQLRNMRRPQMPFQGQSPQAAQPPSRPAPAAETPPASQTPSPDAPQ